ncbi:MAG TPA: hypothetical protein VK186_02825 [Candidatus Deferrimicrobium sp.]|nr:hypothetical protein [Candidatus Deferrimicrobium sp.]
MLITVGSSLFSIVPSYYGARSLSLGYAGTAFSYDLNAIFINPSLLATLPYSLSGYQYQNSYLDNKNFTGSLSDILNYDLKNFASLPNGQKEILFSKLKGLYSLNTGIYGFSANIPGYAGRNYGISVSLVNTAIISPVNPGKDFFTKAPATVTNGEISTLAMNILGLKYKQISLSYAFSLTNEIYFGVTLHYLNGKLNESRPVLISNTFTIDSGSKDYLEQAWDAADKKFSKIIVDLSLNMDVGRYFKVALVTRNVGNPDIKTQLRTITLERRIIAGLALKPDPQWGIYLDMDIAKTDLLHNGDKMQPFSFGIEKGFFNNNFFARAGFISDLTEKHFFGSRSNALYGLGLGFNMKKFVVDFAVGMDSSGSVKNLAISGFILFN